MSAASDSEGCNSNAASCASQTSVARSSTSVKSMFPARSPAQTVRRLRPSRGDGEGSASRRNACPRRRSDTGSRSPAGPAGEAAWHRGDPGVVVDHLALGEPGLRVEDLVDVRDRQLAAVDLYFAALAFDLLFALEVVDFDLALRTRLGRLLLLGAAGELLALDRGERLLEGSHQIGRLGRLRLVGLVGDDVLARGLALDQLEQLRAMLVLVGRSDRNR